jgi:hypothetical protein
VKDQDGSICEVPQNRILLRDDELNILSNDVQGGHAQVFGENFGEVVKDLSVRNSFLKSRATDGSKLAALANSLAQNDKSHFTSNEAVEFQHQESQSRELIQDDEIDIKDQ